MIKEAGFRVIDATLSIEEQQRQMREIVLEVLGQHLKAGVLRVSEGEPSADAEAAPVLQ